MPRFETAQDRSREGAVAQAFADRYKLRQYQTHHCASTDRIFFDGNRVRAVAEIKVRTTPRSKYPTLLVSLDKIVRLQMAAELLEVSPLLIVSWSDEIGWINLRGVTAHSISMGGRRDRPDAAHDIEYLAHYDVAHFKTL